MTKAKQSTKLMDIPPPREREPQHWKVFVERALKRADPAFKENDLGEISKGKYPAIEFLRQLPGGLYVSYSYVRRPYLSFLFKDKAPKYEYKHCYALLFSPTFYHKPRSHPLPPDQFGTRFDFNHSQAAWYAARQLNLKVTEFEPTNQTTLVRIDEVLENSIDSCEKKILPFYLDILKDGKARLLEAFHLGFELMDSTAADAQYSITKHGFLGDLSAFEIARGVGNAAIDLQGEKRAPYDARQFAIQRSGFFRAKANERREILRTLQNI